MNQFEIENHPDFDQHETVRVINSDDLTAMIAVHNTSLGPAVGGCRMYPYHSQSDALKDVLRLSRGMTYKSALAGLPLGGGKSVIIGDPNTDKSKKLLHAMGQFVDGLKGQYITAEDSGTSVADIATIGETTAYVSGVLHDDRFGGDPSPLTAYGVFVGIVEAVRYRFRTDLKGIQIGIQGVGNVGYHLARLLVEAGARVTVADINRANLDRARETLGVNVMSIDDILRADVDVLAPCALGGAISEASLSGIRADVIAGAANNQLATAGMGVELMQRGILYAPDYVINAGGIIDVYYQQCGERSGEVVNGHIEKIGDTLRSIFQQSDETGQPTAVLADHMAEQIFKRDIRAVA